MVRLTLFNRSRSTCSHRVRIVLALKGLDYEYVPVGKPSDEHSGVTYQARSPTGYVPCLVVDGVPYVESVAIIERLEDLVPEPPLYPEDSHRRARVRTLVEIVNSGIQPLQNSSIVAQVAAATNDETAREWTRRCIARGLGAFERAMEVNEREGTAGPYAYGPTPTAADAFLVPQVVAAERVGVDLRANARVMAAFEAAMRLEAFQKADPRVQIDAAPRPDPR